MEDEARVCRIALQDMQRARLDAHNRQSSSDDFGLSAFASVGIVISVFHSLLLVKGLAARTPG